MLESSFGRAVGQPGGKGGMSQVVGLTPCICYPCTPPPPPATRRRLAVTLPCAFPVRSRTRRRFAVTRHSSRRGSLPELAGQAESAGRWAPG
eukprot:274115-Chlamydomonas_euryale.AAC.1